MITYNIETITPAIASAIITEQAESDLQQRKLDKNKVEQYATDMREGRWMENGAAVVLNGTTLLDGQHRLHAVVLSGVALPLLVARGVSTGAFTTIDQGMMRTVPHLLQMRGYNYQNTVVSAARRARQYLTTGRVSLASSPFSAQDMLAFVILHGEALQQASELAHRCKIGHRSVLTTLAFLIRTHPSRADFFDRLESGRSTQSQDAVKMLRELLLVNQRRLGRRASSGVTMAWVILAWNATAEGRRVRRLLYRPTTDKYPTLVVAPPALVGNRHTA